MSKDLSKFVIAIDGPAGAGKSTIARLLAEKFILTYIDTGSMYRAITWLAIKNNINPESQSSELIKLTKDADLKLFPAEKRADGKETFQRVILNGQEITEEIRTPEITRLVSAVSAIAEVRERLVELQQLMGAAGGVILDGRDIGTTVFPNADLKIFLVASSQERALRRQKQLASLGIQQELKAIMEEINKRDYLDYNRKTSPLRQAVDAVLVDTDFLTIEAVVERIIELIEKKLA